MYDAPSGGTLLRERRYVYDGWHLLAELDGSNNLVRSYVWGIDLSGSIGGAGGVGGLLKIIDHGVGGSSHYVAYDANGNVVGLVDATSGAWTAQYEYGPFGELIRATGPMAASNPFRFSTKYTDDESGLLYYGMRYYNPTIGRWISRDPIGEDGGLNLYGFVGNDPISSIDPIGLDPDDRANVVLFPADPGEGLDTTEASFAELVRGKAKKYDWSYFEVESINDANKKLVNMDCKCIKEINILGHANEGFQNLVGIRDPRRAQPGYGRLQARLNRENGKWEYGGLQLFSGMCLQGQPSKIKFTVPNSTHGIEPARGYRTLGSRNWCSLSAGQVELLNLAEAQNRLPSVSVKNT